MNDIWYGRWDGSLEGLVGLGDLRLKTFKYESYLIERERK